jgi:hypothetical protein
MRCQAKLSHPAHCFSKNYRICGQQMVFLSLYYNILACLLAAVLHEYNILILEAHKIIYICGVYDLITTTHVLQT